MTAYPGRTCTVCGNPIPADRPNQLTCSRICGYTQGSWTHVAHQSEVDFIAVARMVAGDPPEHTTRGERIEATRILTRRGHTLRQIGELLRVTPSCVGRYRHERKAAA